MHFVPVDHKSNLVFLLHIMGYTAATYNLNQSVLGIIINVSVAEAA
jgi:hypothetical protein